MSVRPHVEPGQAVEVLIAQPFDWHKREERAPRWVAGFTVDAIAGAGDRAYRVDVDGPRKILGCAPECVRAVLP